MEPMYSMFDEEYEEMDEAQHLSIQAATQLTSAAMASQLLKSGSSTEETAEQVMLFFDIAYRRIRDLAEEDDDYLDTIEENGEIEPL
ncbi:MAG: hypothetical protein KY468_05400 [Armatimonadetes bacterium]|nr:hypothetical protein [Armatimonadota bacterium]